MYKSNGHSVPAIDTEAKNTADVQMKHFIRYTRPTFHYLISQSQGSNSINVVT